MFPAALRSALVGAGLLPVDFAGMVGRTPSYVYGLVNGRHFRPPKDKVELERWADVLRLDGHPRRDFLLFAFLDRGPEFVRAEFLRLRRIEARMEPGSLGESDSGGISEGAQPKRRRHSRSKGD